MKTRIYNLIILDESGSMELVRQEAIEGFNESVKTIKSALKKHPEQQHFVSFVTFNGDGIKTVYNTSRADRVAEIDTRIYHPNSSTPLYDAMGRSILTLKHKLENNKEHPVKVLVTIITDGEENASEEFDGSMIRRLVENLKEQGWVFTYMGANHDVEKFAFSISIQNTFVWESTSEGARNLNRKAGLARERMYDRLSENASIDLNIGYFDDLEEEEG